MHQPASRPGLIVGPTAWYGIDLAKRRDWIVELDTADVAEIDGAIKAFVESGLGMDRISPATFKLPNLAFKLEAILHEVLHGRGFVLVRGFPVDARPLTQAAIGYLGLGCYLGAFRSQNAEGHLLGHVTDVGLNVEDTTTRYYQTNRQLDYHTDSCDIVGLLCLTTAKLGGASRIVSSTTLHNELLRRRPDLLPELFHDFPTDRRGEVPPGMLPWFDVPVFNWHCGELTTIYVGQYIRSAQRNYPAARRLTPAEQEALAILDELADNPELRLQMEFQPGDIQLLHNHQILHSRTDFVDWDEPERRRHLLRLWLAPSGGRALPPAFAARYGTLTPGARGGIITDRTTPKIVLGVQS